MYTKGIWLQDVNASGSDVKLSMKDIGVVVWLVMSEQLSQTLPNTEQLSSSRAHFTPTISASHHKNQH